jgi:hypothetical protein
MVEGGPQVSRLSRLAKLRMIGYPEVIHKQVSGKLADPKTQEA